MGRRGFLALWFVKSVCSSNFGTSIEDCCLGGAFDSNFLPPSSFSVFHCVGHHPSLSNPIESNLITQTLNQKKLLGAESIPNVGVSSVVGMEVLVVVNNQDLNDHSFLRSSLCNPSEPFFFPREWSFPISKGLSIGRFSSKGSFT